MMGRLLLRLSQFHYVLGRDGNLETLQTTGLVDDGRRVDYRFMPQRLILIVVVEIGIRLLSLFYYFLIHATLISGLL